MNDLNLLNPIKLQASGDDAADGDLDEKELDGDLPEDDLDDELGAEGKEEGAEGDEKDYLE